MVFAELKGVRETKGATDGIATTATRDGIARRRRRRPRGARAVARTMGRDARPTRGVAWDEDNLAKNFAERSATMTIDEIETPWHSPPRELFHDLVLDDDREVGRERSGGAAEALAERERTHREVLAKLDALVRRDVRERAGVERDDGDVEMEADGRSTMRGEARSGSAVPASPERGSNKRAPVRFHDPDVNEEDLEDDEEVTKKRLFEAKRKAFQCKGRATKRFEEGAE